MILGTAITGESSKLIPMGLDLVLTSSLSIRLIPIKEWDQRYVEYKQANRKQLYPYEFIMLHSDIFQHFQINKKMGDNHAYSQWNDAGLITHIAKENTNEGIQKRRHTFTTNSPYPQCLYIYIYIYKHIYNTKASTNVLKKYTNTKVVTGIQRFGQKHSIICHHVIQKW